MMTVKQAIDFCEEVCEDQRYEGSGFEFRLISDMLRKYQKLQKEHRALKKEYKQLTEGLRENIESSKQGAFYF